MVAILADMITQGVTAVQDKTALGRGLLKTCVLDGLRLVIWVEVSGLNCRGLSNSNPGQGELLGNWEQWWCTHGIINPLSQFAIGKQVEAQHRCQIGQRPVGFGEVMQPLQQE